MLWAATACRNVGLAACSVNRDRLSVAVPWCRTRNRCASIGAQQPPQPTAEFGGGSLLVRAARGRPWGSTRLLARGRNSASSDLIGGLTHGILMAPGVLGRGVSSMAASKPNKASSAPFHPQALWLPAMLVFSVITLLFQLFPAAWASLVSVAGSVVTLLDVRTRTWKVSASLFAVAIVVLVVLKAREKG